MPSREREHKRGKAMKERHASNPKHTMTCNVQTSFHGDGVVVICGRAYARRCMDRRSAPDRMASDARPRASLQTMERSASAETNTGDSALTHST